jgi:hypothetical protein
MRLDVAAVLGGAGAADAAGPVLQVRSSTPRRRRSGSSLRQRPDASDGDFDDSSGRQGFLNPARTQRRVAAGRELIAARSPADLAG